MACYAAALLVSAPRDRILRRKLGLWRNLWSSACVLMTVHVMAAFHWDHGWSHVAALRHTAEQTARVTGIHWGGGLYFNYLFLGMWIADVIGLWRSSAHVDSRFHRFFRLVLVFMAVNATVVFGPDWWFWPVGAVGIATVLIQFRTGISDRKNHTAAS